MLFPIRQCRECGKPFQPRHRHSLFDGPVCKQHWNNRRRERGAELYDFVMANPANPLIRRMVAAYKAADLKLRGGRPSSQDVDTATMRIPSSYGMDGDGR
jgi:recombinational DNA repair protein (RecF pathway)